jgi:hypothetical protein
LRQNTVVIPYDDKEKENDSSPHVLPLWLVSRAYTSAVAQMDGI